MTTTKPATSGADGGPGAGGDRTNGSEADNRNDLSGNENGRNSGYPCRGLNSRDTATATVRDGGGRFVASDETQRFLALVDAGGDCWLWLGALDRDGYPIFKVRRAGRWVYVRAHRWAYETEHGPIPLGLTLDHRCHTLDPSCPGGQACPHRRCVRPAHLEAVTFAENRRRAHARTRKDQP